MKKNWRYESTYLPEETLLLFNNVTEKESVNQILRLLYQQYLKLSTEMAKRPQDILSKDKYFQDHKEEVFSQLIEINDDGVKIKKEFVFIASPAKGRSDRMMFDPLGKKLTVKIKIQAFDLETAVRNAKEEAYKLHVEANKRPLAELPFINYWLSLKLTEK